MKWKDGLNRKMTTRTNSQEMEEEIMWLFLTPAAGAGAPEEE
jgi:hypothetical protein